MFDYCVHSGSEDVVRWGKDNLYVIKSLREFQHIDDEGIDQGANSTSPRLLCGEVANGSSGEGEGIDCVATRR